MLATKLDGIVGNKHFYSFFRDIRVKYNITQSELDTSLREFKLEKNYDYLNYDNFANAAIEWVKNNSDGNDNFNNRGGFNNNFYRQPQQFIQGAQPNIFQNNNHNLNNRGGFNNNFYRQPQQFIQGAQPNLFQNNNQNFNNRGRQNNILNQQPQQFIQFIRQDLHRNSNNDAKEQWLEFFNIVLVNYFLADDEKVKRNFAVAADFPNPRLRNPSLNRYFDLENAKDIEDESFFSEITSRLKELGYDDNSEAIQYITKVKLLGEFNILISYEIAMTKPRGGCASDFLFHVFDKNIIFHPEESDANIEERAHAYYLMLKSTWNAISEINNDDLKTTMQNRFATEAFGKYLCLEGGHKSIDTWYSDNLAILSSAGNVDHRYSVDKLSLMTTIDVVQKLYSDINNIVLGKNSGYIAKQIEFKKIENTIINNNQNNKMKIGDSHVDASLMKLMVDNYKNELNLLANRIISNSHIFVCSEFDRLLFYKTPDGEILGQTTRDGRITHQAINEILRDLFETELEFDEQHPAVKDLEFADQNNT